MTERTKRRIEEAEAALAIQEPQKHRVEVIFVDVLRNEVGRREFEINVPARPVKMNR